MASIDLNCDVGESFGVYTLGCDEQLLDVVTSANIACGFHAGDPATMRRTVRLALDRGVAIGAHPGLVDLPGFGRREMAISPQEAYDLTIYQVGALSAFVTAAGGKLQHVKPHGALYNMAARDAGLAQAIARAVADVSRDLLLFGLSGSELLRAGQAAGLRTASEVFADRTYQADGSLTPRSLANSVIHNPLQAAQQAVRMIREARVRAVDGADVAIEAQTVCVHGDTPQALEMIKVLRQELAAASVSIRAIGTR